MHACFFIMRLVFFMSIIPLEKKYLPNRNWIVDGWLLGIGLGNLKCVRFVNYRKQQLSVGWIGGGFNINFLEFL